MPEEAGSVPLPPLTKAELKKPASHYEMRGPTDWSNWVIKGRVMAGGYPCCLDDAENDKLLRMLLCRYGIDTFVCLQSEVNLNVPPEVWRAGKAPRPYIHDARNIIADLIKRKKTRPDRKVDFLHLPIPDGGITTDAAMAALSEDVIARVLKGERMYIHCWGGHGRTGTLVGIMLGRLYNLGAVAAIRLTQQYHDSRVNPQQMRSPATAMQRTQVKRILNMPHQAIFPAEGPPVRLGRRSIMNMKTSTLHPSSIATNQEITESARATTERASQREPGEEPTCANRILQRINSHRSDASLPFLESASSDRLQRSKSDGAELEAGPTTSDWSTPAPPLLRDVNSRNGASTFRAPSVVRTGLQPSAHGKGRRPKPQISSIESSFSFSHFNSPHLSPKARC
mmetsp:Transcript_7093/g.8180  ORF Transcript_7093/g.8180 Transcript_7093/m.8180 type:complete len:397 (-) Transcript_7093:465-1655(-)